MAWQRIWLLTIYDLKHNLLGLRGLLFLVPFVLYWIVMFQALRNEMSSDFLSSQQGLAIASMAISPEWVEHLFINNPASLSLVFYILLTTLPGFILLAACNHLAADAGRKSFRYLLTRATRLEIFLSRNLSVLFMLMVAISLLLVYAAYFSLAQDHYSLVETARYALYVFAVGMLYSIPFIAFAAIFSALCSGLIGAFLSASTALFIIMMVRLWNRETYPWVDFLLPSVMKESLLGLGVYEPLMCVVSLSAHTLIFGAIAWWLFARRDL